MRCSRRGYGLSNENQRNDWFETSAVSDERTLRGPVQTEVHWCSKRWEAVISVCASGSINLHYGLMFQCQMNFSPTVAFLAVLSCLAISVQAQTQYPGQPATKSTDVSAESKAPSSAQVVKVYPQKERILLQHGPIPSLGMSAMTMEFGLRNSKMLNSLHPGDKVKFTAEQVNGDYVVTFIELAK